MMTPGDAADATTGGNMAMLRDLVRRYGWLYRIRPQALAEPFYRLVGPYGGRAIVKTAGVRLYVDPFSTMGRVVVDGGDYEPHIVTLIGETVPAGGTFLDIGANEGLFSAIAAKAAGPNGLVIAVEPQSRLRDILEINLALNRQCEVRIYQNAVSDGDGEILHLNLGPTSHTGGSSLVRRYRWRPRSEPVTTRSVDSILAELGNPHVDLMKVDVEGFEHEVVLSAAETLARKGVAVLAVDYHGSQLARRGLAAAVIDDHIRAAGYRSETVRPESGYIVYRA